MILKGLSFGLLSLTPSMPSRFYSEGGKTYLAECICRRHTNEVVCATCPPSIRHIFTSGFNLDSAGKKARSGLSRRAFACKRCCRRLTVTKYLGLAFTVLDSASISACIAIVLGDYPDDSVTQRTLNGLLSRLADVGPARLLDSLETSESIGAIDTPRTLTARPSTSSEQSSTVRRLLPAPIPDGTYPTPTRSTSKKRHSTGGDSAERHPVLTTAFYKRPRLQIQDCPSDPSATTSPSVSIPSAIFDRLPSQLSEDLTKVFSALSELSTGLVSYFPASSADDDLSPLEELSPTLEIASDTTIPYSPAVELRSDDPSSSPAGEPAFEDLPFSRAARQVSFPASPSPLPGSGPSPIVEGGRLASLNDYPVTDLTTTLPLTTSTPSRPLLTTTEQSETSPDALSDLLTRFDRARDSSGRKAVWREVRRLDLGHAFAAARAKLHRNERRDPGEARG